MRTIRSMRPLKQDQCRTNSSPRDPWKRLRAASAGETGFRRSGAAENLRCHAPLSVGCRPFRTSRPGILLQIHQLALRQVAAARQPLADSADRNTEDRGGFFIGYAFQTDEEDHLSLLVGQAGDARSRSRSCKDASASSAAVSAGAVVNGVAAVPIMVLLMIMTARRAVMGEFTIGYGLKTLGWAATLAMVACVIGMVLTALV